MWGVFLNSVLAVGAGEHAEGDKIGEDSGLEQFASCRVVNLGLAAVLVSAAIKRCRNFKMRWLWSVVRDEELD